VLSYPEVSTVIPGIRTAEQAVANTEGPFQLHQQDVATLNQLHTDRLSDLLGLMQEEEKQ
jgi:hypothetical protein